MKFVLDEFRELLPVKSRSIIEPLISDVRFLYFPDESRSLRAVKNPHNCIVVMNHSTIKDCVDLISLGFYHVIQKKRLDFPQELMASALMIARPKAFLTNPAPFILSGGASSGKKDRDKQLELKFRSTDDRLQVLGELQDFLRKRPDTAGIADLCVQSADELFANALFHAPTNRKGVHLHQHLPRTEKVSVPDAKASRLFCKISDYRVVLGCEDSFGSLKKRAMLNHLVATLAPEKVKPRGVHSHGAGLGIRFMVGNSANFYMYSDPGKRTIVACGFITAGLRANLSAQKHLHLSL